jgi:hypothetical protein
MGTLLIGPLRNRQIKFGQDLFQILPDLSAVLFGIIAQQISGMKSGHKFYWFVADAGDIFMEQSP